MHHLPENRSGVALGRTRAKAAALVAVITLGAAGVLPLGCGSPGIVFPSETMGEGGQGGAPPTAAAGANPSGAGNGGSSGTQAVSSSAATGAESSSASTSAVSSGASGSAASSSSASSGSGGPVDCGGSASCNQCRMCAEAGPCAGLLAACKADAQCSAYEACIKGCQVFEPLCPGTCGTTYPKGKETYSKFTNCVDCEQCKSICIIFGC